MLEIQEGDEVVLPEKYHRLHNVSVMLHDQMAVVAADENYEPFRRGTFDIDKDARFVDELRRDEIDVLDFFEANGMVTELNDSVVREIVPPLLVDFLHFIYESLSSAKKGKISVAYALLRKPLTDLLLLFEQILVNKQDFVQRFHHDGAPVTYDPSFANLDRKDIVTQACATTKLRDIFDANFIYALRYDKESQVGIASSTHRALHVVTRNKHFHTRNRDFNFVFDSVSSLENYWSNYYKVVTYLLCYAAAVVDEIAFSLMPDQIRAKHVKDVQRFFHFAEISVAAGASSHAVGQETLFEYLDEALVHQCKTCGHELHFTKPDYTLFAATMLLLCSECQTDQFTDVEFFDKFHAAWHPLVPMYDEGTVTTSPSET